MKSVLRAALVLVLALACAEPRIARANGYLDDWHPYQTYWAVGWSLGFPLDSMRATWSQDPGWLGGGFDARVGVVQRLAVGVSGTWNFFDQTYKTLTVEQGNFTFTGPVYRSLQSFTFLGTVHYYLTQTAVQPFVGFGFGGAWLTAQQNLVNRQTTYDTSGLTIAPELGLLFTFGPRFGLYLSGRYQMVFTTYGDVRNPTWVTGQTGIAYYF
jgi:hypothetical protein